jgi:hypothetical protein
LQPRVFSAAETVFVVSEGLKQFYEPLYPTTDFVPLVHSFNEPLQEAPAPRELHSPLRLAFVGNLNDSNIDAMRRLAEVANRRSNCCLTIYSGTPEWFFQKVGIAGERFAFRQVPFDQLTADLRQHDILMLPHGFSGGLSEAEYRTIFPTRAISCLMVGRPILAHSPPDSYLTRWLREHDCAEIVDIPSTSKLEEALERLAADFARRQVLVHNALVAVRQFEAPRVAATLRNFVFGIKRVGDCEQIDEQSEYIPTLS